MSGPKVTGVIVNRVWGILEFLGRTGHYLEFPPGAAELNLLRMVRLPLQLPLREAMEEVSRTGRAVRKTGIPLSFDYGCEEVSFEVAPWNGHPSGQAAWRVLLDSAPVRSPNQLNAAAKIELLSRREAQANAPALRRELLAAKQHLEAMLDENSSKSDELQAANEQLAIANAGLEAINSELEVVNSDLNQAREEALDLAVAKSRLLANMSHEIRTPLNGVIAMTDLLAWTELSSQQRDYVETIRGSGEALLTVINDILDYSKSEAGKLAVESIEFDLEEVVEGTIEMAAGRAHEQGVELVPMISADVPSLVCGDPRRLRQVLLNLVDNARKFTEQGEVVVKVDLAHQTDDRATVRFEVVDTGVGISPKIKARLFEPFGQADESTTRKFGGTGLGLTIAKQLVELMGGAIEVESVEGEGSTFAFDLPFTKSRSAAVTAPSPLLMLEGMRALIADACPAVREALRRRLEIWSVSASDVEELAEALREIRRAAREGAPYHVLLVETPRDGAGAWTDFVSAIRGEPAVADLHTVLLVPYGSGPRNLGDQSNGRTAILTKPVRRERLHQCLKTLFSSASVDVPGEIASPRVASRNRRILVAEDNPINQRVIMAILDQLGYSADVVVNGREVLRVLGQRAYDAILMDCQMPEMDGYEATAEIRRRQLTSSRTPIIALTASAMAGDYEKCLHAGMNDYLTKPVSPQTVAEALERWTSREDGYRVTTPS